MNEPEAVTAPALPGAPVVSEEHSDDYSFERTLSQADEIAMLEEELAREMVELASPGATTTVATDSQGTQAATAAVASSPDEHNTIAADEIERLEEELQILTRSNTEIGDVQAPPTKSSMNIAVSDTTDLDAVLDEIATEDSSFEYVLESRLTELENTSPHGSNPGSTLHPSESVTVKKKESRSRRRRSAPPTDIVDAMVLADLKEREELKLAAVDAIAASGEIVMGDETERGCLQRVVSSRWFEGIVLGAIGGTCVQLVLYDACDDDSSSIHNQLNRYTDYLFLAVFTLELVLKHVAFGLREYWTNGWNRLDALVVATGFLSLMPSMEKIVIIRLLRVLRPLRILNKLEGMKRITKTLASAAVPLADTAILCCLMFFMFGIVGITLFAGCTRRHCYNVLTVDGQTSYELDTSVEYSYGIAMCGGDYECSASQVCSFSASAPNFSLTGFDNILMAFLSIFVAITLEGWVDNMYMLQDSYSYWGSTIYFHLLIVLGSLFIVNLALAVLADSFDLVLDESEDKLLTTDDDAPDAPVKVDAFGREIGREIAHKVNSRRLSVREEEEAQMVKADQEAGLSKLGVVRRHHSRKMSIQMMQDVEDEDERLEKVKSDLVLAQEQEQTVLGKCRERCFDFASSEAFGDVILVFIIVNLVCLAMEHKRTEDVNGVQQATKMDSGFEDGLNYANYVFVIVFALEALVKLVGFGFKEYFSDKFNLFDFVVVVCSFVEIAVAGDGSFSALRSLRLIRVFKLTKRWTSMRVIMTTILDTLPQMGYLCLTLFLFMFLSAIAGMQLFGCKLRPPTLEDKPRGTFDNFGVAMLTVFQILGGENWNDVMYNSVEATNYAAALYFMLIVVSGTFIILNLTLAVLLSNFGAGSSPEIDFDHIALVIQDFALCICPCFKDKSASTVVPEEAYQIPESSQPVQDAVWVETIPFRPGGARRESKLKGKSETSDALCESKDEPVSADVGADQPNPLLVADIPTFIRGNSLSPVGDTVMAGLASLVSDSLTDGQLEDTEAVAVSGVNRRSKAKLKGWFAASETLSASAGRVKPSAVSSAKTMLEFMSLSRYFYRLKTAWFMSTAPDAYLLAELGDTMEDTVRKQALRAQREEEVLDAQRDCTGFVPVPVELTGVSLWLFSPDNKLRIALSKVAEHPLFDNFILFCILSSSICLALETPGMDQDSTKAKNLELADIVFTSVFTLEMLTKVLVMGFILDKNAYLKHGFNVLDFFIVVISLLSVSKIFSSDGFRALRTLRSLRPLRTIKRAPGLRCVVDAIFRCMPGFINIALVSSVVYLVFAIMGVQFWSGKFWKCTDDSVANVQQCIGFAEDGTPRQWQNAPINFDNVSNGMLTLFEVASMELWLDVMYHSMDAPSEIGLQPEMNRQWWASIFYVIFIIVGPFLIMNLFVGAVVDTFNTVKSEIGRASTLTEEQLQFVTSLNQMSSSKPKPIPMPLNGEGCIWRARCCCFNLVTSDRFDASVIVVIVMNIVVMSMVWWENPGVGVAFDSDKARESQRTPWNLGLDWCNTAFTVMFAVEAALKLIGLGCRQYFMSAFNIFDFLVLTTSVAGFILDTISSDSGDATILKLVLIFRAARVMRVFRLTIKFSGVRRLLETLLFALPSLMNVTMLLGLILFIFTIIGMNLFGENKLSTTSGYDHYGLHTKHANFSSFWKGFFTLFRMSTGESWNGIMHDIMAESGNSASIFFVLYMVIASSLLFNLVVAILLEEFSSRGQADGYKVTPADLDHFLQVWSQFDPEARLSIRLKQVPALLLELGEPLGVPEGTSLNGARAACLNLFIPVTNGRADFVEILSALMRSVFSVQTLDAEVLFEAMSQLNQQFPELVQAAPRLVRARSDEALSQVQENSESSKIETSKAEASNS